MRSGGRCVSPMTQTAWRCPRRWTARGGGCGCVFRAIIGTGVGGGVVVDGRVLRGPKCDCRRWDHNPLPLPDTEDLPLPPCYCGRLVCIETWLSGPGLLADHLRHGGVGDRRSADCNRQQSCLRGQHAAPDERRLRFIARVINIPRSGCGGAGGRALEMSPRLYANVPRLWDATCLFRPGGYASWVKEPAWRRVRGAQGGVVNGRSARAAERRSLRVAAQMSTGSDQYAKRSSRLMRSA